MIFVTEFIPIPLSKAGFFFFRVDVFFPFLFTPSHPAVYKIGLSHSAWGVFYYCAVKIAKGVFKLLYLENRGSCAALLALIMVPHLPPTTGHIVIMSL